MSPAKNSWWLRLHQKYGFTPVLVIFNEREEGEGPREEIKGEKSVLINLDTYFSFISELLQKKTLLVSKFTKSPEEVVFFTFEG